MNIERFKPDGVCAELIIVAIDDEKVIQKVKFNGGCDGGLKGVSALLVGMRVETAIEILQDIKCGNKDTSCPAELAKCLKNLY